MTEGLVPASILSDPAAARRRVAFLAGVACAGSALAGLFLRFEDGLLMRLVIATTSAIFGGLVVHVALAARDAWSAVGRTLGLSSVLGIVSTIVPSVIVASDQSLSFVGLLVLDAFFGSFTGFLYGIVLAALAGLAWKDLASGTHDGADRAMRTAAIWAFFPGLAMTWIATGYDAHRELSEWTSAADRAAHAVAVPLGLTGAALTMGTAFVLAVAAQRRLRRRSEWLARVAFGPTSEWGLRTVGPHDDLSTLPRLRDGVMILEHRQHVETYRVHATGEAVAVI